MIIIATGIPGAGKSLWTAKKALEILDRNYRFYKKSGIIRQVYSNLRFSTDIEAKFGNFISYWDDPEILVRLLDVDIIWDEVATHLDNTQWANLPLEIKRFLQQHRKRGIEIYGNTQEFLMIDVSMRRLVNEVYFLTKLFGSRDPSPTRPPVNKIWGFILVRKIDPKFFEDEKNRKFIKTEWFSIRSKYVYAFDTRQEIKLGNYPPLKHIERHCIDPDCPYHRTIHI